MNILGDLLMKVPAPGEAVSSLTEWRNVRWKEFLGIATLDWLKFVGALTAAGYAIYTFTNGNKIKSAELLVTLERDYGELMEDLLKVERKSDYEKEFKTGIVKCNAKELEALDLDEVDAMDRFEKILRYFHVCCSIRKLGVNKNGIRDLCHYYLDVLVPKKNGVTYREEQEAYIKEFWPAVYKWGVSAHRVSWRERIKAKCCGNNAVVPVVPPKNEAGKEVTSGRKQNGKVETTSAPVKTTDDGTGG